MSFTNKACLMHCNIILQIVIPSNTFIHTLFLLFYVYKLCHISFV